MNFLAPTQLAWAAGAIVVVLLYVHWATRKSKQTTTLPIWRHAIARRSWWSRWRKLVSVVVACVPILLIALALARPLLLPFVESSRTIVVVVDNTASMNAQPGGQSRLEQAKRAARRLIRNLRTHDRMAILSADSGVRVRCGLTSDRTALHLALDSVQPTDGTGAMHDGIATARQLVQGEARPVVVVISDAGFNEASSEEDVVWIPVTNQVENVAITNLAARPVPGTRTAQQVLIEVANFGSESSAVKIQWQLNEAELPPMDVQIPAGETVQRIMTVEAGQPALLKAHLVGEDALAADNTAQVLLSPAPVTRVLLLTEEEDSPLEKLLRSLSGVEVTTVNALPSELKNVDVAVLVGDLPDDIPNVPTLILDAAQSNDLWTVVGESSSPQAAIASVHPLLQGVDLRDVVFDKIPRLELQAGTATLWESTDGDPLIAWHARPAGDVVLMNCSPVNSDIQWHDDFPRLISNALAWLTRGHAMPRSSWRTDETVVADEEHTANEFTSPYGMVRSGGANLIDVGLWRVTKPNSEVAFIPVNLTNANESASHPPEDALNQLWPYTSWLPDFGPLWMPLVALSLVWLAGQWAFYNRGAID